MTQWRALLSTRRIGQAAQPEASVRSEFQRDGDRIIFSAAFRRMQDKTQVFPLAQNDYVRTRLTHSLEVACVGRSLGSSVGAALLQRYPELRTHIQAADIGDIVAAACLAHDIGNPPFGHFGEQAMRDYFISGDGQNILPLLDNPYEAADLCMIEGNAQGFRILNRLESIDLHGGLRLTAATLATASKYPCTAYAQQQHNGLKKNGCYQDDLIDFADVFSCLELPQVHAQTWQRHPLSFLMEAADDICYLIVDIEDAYQVGQITYTQALELLHALGGELVEQSRFDSMHSHSDKLGYLRAKAIGKLVHETVEQFWHVEQGLLDGSHTTPLLKHIPSIRQLNALREYAAQYIYISRPVVEIQIAGYRILTGLLDVFCHALTNRYSGCRATLRHDSMTLALLPTRYVKAESSLYRQILGVCDYITGMTDSYAVSLYKKLTGISLPVD